MYRYSTKLIAGIVACCLLLAGGCSAPEPADITESQTGEEMSPASGGFAIYLTKDDIPPERVPVLSHIELADRPVISIEDIVSYDPDTYALELTRSAYERVASMGVPVRGLTFMVCVDGGPVYHGAFWTMLSSAMYDGVTIMQPLNTDAPPFIVFGLGYPSEDYYGGTDPRNDQVIIRSLEAAGKIAPAPSSTDLSELRLSFKGYELYSWQDGEEWHFTLITGTNRTKTLDEIIAVDTGEAETGLVRIHVIGVDAIKEVLGMLPEGESVFWLGGAQVDQTDHGGIVFSFPSQSDIDAVTSFAVDAGLKMMVAVP